MKLIFKLNTIGRNTACKLNFILVEIGISYYIQKKQLQVATNTYNNK